VPCTTQGVEAEPVGETNVAQTTETASGL